MAKVAVIMGSDSDLTVVQDAVNMLDRFGVEHDVRIISAHRSPEAAREFAINAQENGVEIIIAAAGKAAHLAGVLAAYTPLPVIGIPIKSSTMDGLDSLLSTVQMPAGVPVATVAINGAKNAALLAVQMLGIKYPNLKEAFMRYKSEMAEEISKKNLEINI